MAKKDKETKSSKAEEHPIGPDGVPKKPTLFKRIVNTIESMSKDRKRKEAAEQAIQEASQSRRELLDQAAEGLSAPADAGGPGAVAASGGAGTERSAGDEVMEKSKKKSNTAKAKPGKDTEGEPSKASSEKPAPAVITIPPVASVYTSGQSESSTLTAKAAKFDIEPPQSAQSGKKPVVPIALAEQIYATRLVLLVRDPEMLYAYWDISDEDRKIHRLDSLVPPRHLALRLFDHGRDAQPAGHALVYIDFLLQPGVDSRYLRLPLKDRWWRADLGVKDEMIGFTPLARSNTVRSPRDQVAEWGAGTKPLMEAHVAHAEASSMPATGGEPVQPTLPTREGIFAGTFRLSGGTVQGIAATRGEIVETHTETRSTLRVRPAGSSAMTAEEERESLSRLKVRSVGASDLTSRQG